MTQNTVAYAATSNEKARGIVGYLVEAASDEPLSVDGTVFVSVPLPEGFPEDCVVSELELVGEPAVQFYRTEIKTIAYAATSNKHNTGKVVYLVEVASDGGGLFADGLVAFVPGEGVVPEEGELLGEGVVPEGGESLGEAEIQFRNIQE
ncbi:hypothetical protein Tco_0814109 [Tanacetum coccineum]